MAGKGSKRARLSAETSRANRRDSSEPSGSSQPIEQGAQYYLPTDLLKDILSQLSLRDNIRASLVCKTWLDVALSVRRADRPPWLINLPQTGQLYEFYNPSNRKTYGLEFPELQGAKVSYAKDGWLLLFKPRTQQILFFCPYTLELIKIPDFEVSYQIVAFSAAPTSPSCVLFMVRHINASIVAISTYRLGDSAWTTINYETNLPFVSSIWNKVVFCNGVFHCLNVMGWLGIYDHENRNWSVLDVIPPLSTELFPLQSWWKGKFVAEHNGDIYVLYTCPGVDPTTYKLNRVTPMWEEVQDFGGKTFFANFLTSYIKADLLGNMRNNIYFSKVLYYGKRCVRYSLEDKRYYPRKGGFDWEEQEPFDGIWFDTPEDLSAMF